MPSWPARSKALAKEVLKRCLIVLDALPEPIMCWLQLPAAATISDAMAQARRQLKDQYREGAIDWDAAATGLWGVIQPRSAVPRDGDRIEVYRGLQADPRVRRRQRAKAAR